MEKQFLETGQIVSTHGIRGEVRILPWCDTPEFLLDFDTLYLDERPVKVLSAKVYKGNLLVCFEGVADVEAAMRLKGKTVCIRRDGIRLPDGRHFIADLIGLEVRSDADGQVLGTLSDVWTPSKQHVYVVKGDREYLIPAVDEFITEINPADGYLTVRLIEGM